VTSGQDEEASSREERICRVDEQVISKTFLVSVHMQGGPGGGGGGRGGGTRAKKC
jgi:hypothetical protein